MSHGDDQSHDDYDERFDSAPPPKTGMSGGMKILLILLIIFGVCALMCCGGVVYFVQKMKAGASSDPAVIKRVTQEITTIDVQPPFKPVQSVEFEVPFVPKIKMVVYQGKDQKTVLMMIQIDVPEEEMNEAQREDVRKRMREQGHNAGELNNIEELQPIETTIRGKQATFQLRKGTDSESGVVMIHVQGVFKGKNGMVMLFIQTPESEFKREDTEKLLKSIK